MAGALSQASVAVALPLAATLVSAGQFKSLSVGKVIAGAVMSCTVMVCTHSLKLPQSSVAFQLRLRTWVPGQEAGSSAPVLVMAGALSQASVAVALPLAATLVSAGQFKSLSVGQVITGAVMSCTVMVCTHSLKLPQASVAFQLRLMT